MKNIKYLVLITQVGIDIISGIAAGLVIGMLLDKLFKTNSIFTLILLIIGIFSGLNIAYRRLSRMIEKKKNKEDKSHE
ncbi:putative F0F1-ATPase subunit (Ca2+/Mg2+ transporter) [Ezakiella coagulans]|uniref:Putative F0F1-ATPase subunit (Ca2+/Mg2+ transporter) n=1 Tax=Ezakiella coagulans TaxID=46507 RepID=A0A2U1E3E8_9FIRM|nr:AtpZ/AtpI family protein [Ezakiella coagulans]PVY94229.1 putative F0F1-ATPase subunit (Ca2+/Mg2+ transporter) [Ezakiella coagulans]